MRNLPVVIVCLILLVMSTLRAEDWPEFRGPTGQGVSSATGLPMEWGPEKNIVWKAAIPGTAWSSPVVQAGRIYLTTAVPGAEGDQPDLSLRTLCLDSTNGEILWDREVFKQSGADAPKIHAKNSHASPTPVAVSDRLYVHFGHQGTACLDLNGNPIWTNRELVYAPVHGNGCSPILVDDLIVFSCDGANEPFVAALDAGNGSLRWKFLRAGEASKKFAFCTPLAIELNGRKQIVSPGADVVNGLDAQTGEELWSVKYKGYSVIPRPVYGHGLVFISTSYDSPSVLAIQPDGEGDVTDSHVMWQMKKGAPHTPSLLLVGEELYMVSDGGVATCVDAKTGAQHWQKRVPGNYSASPLLADGKIYLQNETGIGTVLQPGKEFVKLAENGFPERTLASYAVAEGALFVRTEKHLYRIEQLGSSEAVESSEQPEKNAKMTESPGQKTE